jgi:hypothetical protein
MLTKPPVIVRTDYRQKRPPKRKIPVAIPMRIVSARQPRPAAPVIDVAVTERKPAQAATITGPRIVTARKPKGRFPDVPEMTAEEHQQRGNAAEALFREIVRRAARGVDATA